MRRAAWAAVVVPVLAAAGCSWTAGDPEPPVELVEEPRTIGLGFVGGPFAVDGDTLVHVVFRGDHMVVVRRDLRSGSARTLLRRVAEPWSVEEIAARDGRVAVEMSAHLRGVIAHRILDLPPSGARPRVLERASERTGCAAKVSLHNMTPARAVLVSRVRVGCPRGARGGLVLRLRSAAGSRTVLRRQLIPDVTGRLGVVGAGVGGGRALVADDEHIEVVEPSGRRRLIESGDVIVGAEINDQGDVLFHEARDDRLRTSLLPRHRAEPLELVEGPLGLTTLQLCGGLIVRYALGDGREELAVAPTTDPKRFRPLRAWPDRLADADVTCDERSAVLLRQRHVNAPMSAEVVALPK